MPATEVASPTYTSLHYERTGRDVLVISLPLEEGSNTRQYSTYDPDGPVDTTGGIARPPFKRFIPADTRISPRDFGSVRVTTGNERDIQPSVSLQPYSEALSSIAVKCVDILVVDVAKGLVLLGDRDQEPQPDIWVIGGRKRAGETDAEAAQRNLARELGIKPSPRDFIPIGMTYDMIWDTREQAPLTNEDGLPVTGSHMVSTPLILPVDKDALRLKHNEEYSNLIWERLDDIVDSPAGTYHPALVDMVFDTMERLSRPDSVRPDDHATLAFRAITTAAYHKAQLV